MDERASVNVFTGQLAKPPPVEGYSPEKVYGLHSVLQWVPHYRSIFLAMFGPFSEVPSLNVTKEFRMCQPPLWQPKKLQQMKCSNIL